MTLTKMINTKLAVILSIILLSVACDKQDPTTTLTVDKSAASVGETVSIKMSATDNTKIQTYILTLSVMSSDSVEMDWMEIYRNDDFNESSIDLDAYDYTVPVTTSMGDSLMPGYYLEILGSAVDKKSQGYPVTKYVTIQ